MPAKRWGPAGLVVVATLGAFAVVPAGANAEGTGIVANPVAMTLSGPVRGESHETVDTYQGVPYAAPPVGPLRWEPHVR